MSVSGGTIRNGIYEDDIMSFPGSNSMNQSLILNSNGGETPRETSDSISIHSATNSIHGGDGNMSISASVSPNRQSNRPSLASVQSGDVRSPSTNSYKSPRVHKMCPHCSGRGRVLSDQVERETLVALVPYNDNRLKPRRTKFLIASSAAITIMLSVALCFVLWPRPVTYDAQNSYLVKGLIGSGDRNCPASGASCADRVETINNQTEYIEKCNSMPGCVYLSTRKPGCVGCSELSSHSLIETCIDDHNCVYIEPNSHSKVPQPKDSCESAQMGPVSFEFNYTMTVHNSNYIEAVLAGGEALLSFTDSSEEGREIEVMVATASMSKKDTKIVPARSTRDFILKMNASVTMWNYANTSNPTKITNYTAENELKRKIIHDICDKCGAFQDNAPRLNQFFANFKLNLTANVMSTAFGLDHSGIVRLECVRAATSSTTTTTTTTTTSHQSDLYDLFAG